MIYKNNNFIFEESDLVEINDERFDLMFEHEELFKELFDRDILSFKDYMISYSHIMRNFLSYSEDETKRILLSRKATVQQLLALRDLFDESQELLFYIDNDFISIDEVLLLTEDCMHYKLLMSDIVKYHCMQDKANFKKIMSLTEEEKEAIVKAEYLDLKDYEDILKVIKKLI